MARMQALVLPALVLTLRTAATPDRAALPSKDQGTSGRDPQLPSGLRQVLRQGLRPRLAASA
eukprot:CAMPEP_0204155486 /NCGR_PEP_ID=MMETSP0361-20130328/29628_1 /ASSEMBLY_ACC=CAM_ASM_000343 /TAXON_ID=268821 /ORGANISM="Scrippsiella Hangoei, Strain SHTV-5" /LENGTH=61 /DNA_ID=CAMNT_0051110965 /DNA_START=77 /DNA_END=262 /DNA_ORIENTATION=+